MKNQTESNSERLAYPVDEFCRLSGFGRTFFYAMVKSGKIKTIKIGGKTLISRDEAERLARGEVR